MTPAQAIRLFCQQVALRNDLPFETNQINEATRKTFRETDANRNLTVCDDADDLFDKLGI
ncbi:MAG: type II toxin-antitoxin system RelB/DinJ family antitoxin [Desulfococcaceae bacterium]